MQKLRQALQMKPQKLADGVVESPWIYRQRTTKIIYRLCKEAGVRMIFQKACLVVCREAWKELRETSSSGNPVAYLRNARSRMWWEGLKVYATTQRTAGDTKRRRSGPVRMWEDALCTAFGLDSLRRVCGLLVLRIHVIVPEAVDMIELHLHVDVLVAGRSLTNSSNPTTYWRRHGTNDR